ncbi:MAG: ribosome maturation factor RimP [Coriobacteriales bacterium]|nr:ribosome maturation factor RimP [Coriobacteriales bacterium]
MRSERHQKLIDALEAAAAQHGLELVDVELSGTGRMRVVRVFLEREGGIGIDELAAANLWVDETVEANEPYTGAYTLEVSSPGIDRPLRTLAHFARFVGEEARLVTEPLDGRGKWTGIVVGVEGEDILLEVDGETRRIPHGKIRHAHLKGRIEFNKERKEEREERTEHVI